MTLIHLVRHGETIWHAENRYAGRSEVPLTKRGREQADALAGWAVTTRITSIWCSPQERARETARPTVEATGLRLNVDADLREMDFGAAEGLTLTEVGDVDPGAAAAFTVAPATSSFPGGETGVAVAARASAAVDRLAAHEPDGDILVIGHSTTTRLLLCALLEMDLDRYRSVFPVIGNCTVTTIRLGRANALLSFNTPVPAGLSA
jgi:probable phosphoglycerate mutase